MPVISRNERRMVSRYENLDTTQTYSGSGTCERSSRMREQQTVFSHTHWHTLTEVHSHRHTLTFKRWTMQFHRKTEICTDTLTFRHTNTGILRHLHSDTDTLTQIQTHSLQVCNDWSVEVYCVQCLQVQYSLFHLCGLQSCDPFMHCAYSKWVPRSNTFLLHNAYIGFLTSACSSAEENVTDHQLY